jgi:23S rRNA (uracil1939-C5)-methyltransferase
MTLKPGDVAELTVEKAAAGGEMLARRDGQVVLVSGAIPGERVRARIERLAKRVAHARVVDIIDPSPDRREPFDDPLCGGCVYSHIAYARQLALKSGVIADAFTRIGKLSLPAPVTVLPSPETGYRMRARLHVRGGRAGFFREATHEVCDVRPTRQLLPATCDALDRLMAAARSLGAGGALREIELSENVGATERVIHLDTSDALDPRVAAALLAAGDFTAGPYVTDVLTFGDRAIALRRHVLAFFQGNRHLLHALVAHVTGQLQSGATVIDLYAGAGLFAIAAATLRDATVTAVEGDRYAADDLHANAAVAGTRVRGHRASVEAFAEGMATTDAVIVDPPRTGMTTQALAGVMRARPATLIYVSCDVATLARDASMAVAHGYTIAGAQAFDLFPNTPHVETVVVFRI